VTLYVESHGSGRPLVLLHGWATNGQVWHALVEELADDFALHIVDLPGHGRSSATDGFDLRSAARLVADCVPEDATWVGWSLGGLVAMQAAIHQAPLSGLVLTGASPRFTAAGDWPHATQVAILDEFARSLRDDWQATLRRFLVLQARGSERSREEIRYLRRQVLNHGQPDLVALDGALAALRDEDLRAELSQIRVPTLVLHGQRDLLVPLETARFMVGCLPQAKLVTVPRAAHAPMVSHPRTFAEAMREFLHA
jgi:pimeloyl-[acyl-carrier protein] methyl ester esterase